MSNVKCQMQQRNGPRDRISRPGSLFRNSMESKKLASDSAHPLIIEQATCYTICCGSQQSP